MNHTTKTIALIAIALSIAAPAAFAEEKAPMPQTKGMQGVDPAQHDKWAKEGKQDPYKDCKPNADKAAQQAKSPMPETKGMKGMDPKAHTVECPEPEAAKQDPDKAPKHVHKAP
jgi:hypothetical protein